MLTKTSTFTHYLGIDFSKATLDLSLTDNTGASLCKPFKVTNDTNGFEQLLKQLKRFKKLTKNNLMIVGEHTGRYCLLITHLFVQDGWLVWLENPKQIKYSSGVQKGKTDAADARQISRYGMRYQDRFTAYRPNTDTIIQLDALLKQFENCKRNLKSYQLSYKDITKTLTDCNIPLDETLLASHHQLIAQMKSNMALLESKMDELIASDAELKQQMKILVSIPGIGIKTARAFAVYTHGFTRLISAPELKSYCGVAPFVYESGTSVKNRTKVNHNANKHLKALLHMCAMRVCRLEGELQEYYLRKVAEGKNKMLVINNLRAKLIDRIVAVLKRRTPYIMSAENLHLS